MCSVHRKNHGCGQKKPKSTSSAILGVETAAKCCELKRCVERVRNRTDKANLNFSPELYRQFFFRLNWTFRLPPKRQLSILLSFLFPLTNLLLNFAVFACFATTWVTMRFCAKNTGFNTGFIQCMPLHISDPVVRTDRQSHDFYITTQISWLDRLPNLFSNGAPRIR